MHVCPSSYPRTYVSSYPDIGGLAFGTKGRNIVTFFIYLEIYLVAVDLLILEGENLEKLLPNMTLKLAGLKIHG
ncbi:hypothetical protein QQ045_033169 [Rhodiola kirilowii]